MPSAAERNQRLDDLQTATKEWAAESRKEIDNRIKAGKKILKGRTGSERLSDQNVQAGVSIVVEQINDFLQTE